MTREQRATLDALIKANTEAAIADSWSGAGRAEDINWLAAEAELAALRLKSFLDEITQ